MTVQRARGNGWGAVLDGYETVSEYVIDDPAVEAIWVMIWPRARSVDRRRSGGGGKRVTCCLMLPPLPPRSPPSSLMPVGGRHRYWRRAQQGSVIAAAVLDPAGRLRTPNRRDTPDSSSGKKETGRPLSAD
ncbi:hypothetical protein Tdes44962_MAKER07100 [Teratosphaeria destructans]|uniref:Uncharacterized protein n=1 Tax=Teratosphaeria destructans TaxID=418781 RepID=A0A9W7SZP6_9PEZI|nr:hypothetical protein Tdes44962_MAKER07100 [Teratosphaeria destructans]